jgi:deazaflavin-dependent oxidoreductase (nitroreductase family)
MGEVDDFNAGIIDEFRANAGRVGGMFEGTPMVLLTTTGARTGRRRTNPLAYLPDGDRVIVIASNGGAPTHPGWYHNLLANPDVTVEVGAETYEGTASVLTGEERDRLFAMQASRFPQLAEYRALTRRTIPVVALERKGR